MAQLICEDCGEVIKDGLTESEADDLESEHGAEDKRDGAGGEGESGGSGGGKQPDRKDVEDLEEEMEEEYKEKADEIEDEDTPEEVGNDAQDYFDAATDAGISEPEFMMGESSPPPQARWEECKSKAERISRIFGDKLRQKRREKVHREKRSGRFDSRKMIAADRGSSRVFKQRDEGDELEYETYFILDRSSSMRGDGQEEAENAVATLMKALEDCGVKTELVEFSGSNVRVVKTKSQDIESEVGNILRLDSKGGTPIDDVTELVSERITGTEGKPFVIIVTDAEISGNTKDNYLETVENMNCPVLGVTIGEDANIETNESQRVYHYAVEADVGEPLEQKLTDLARNVML